MTGALAHRGPDGDGHWSDPAAGISLGHRRLAILDLSSAAAQPMASPSGRYLISYNGELYNWQELRAEESRHGMRWRGHSDTEVLLALCDRVGIRAAIERAAGMFALAIWDREQRTLSLVRDRLGEKPLYYGYVGDALVFASELKALRAHPGWQGRVNRDALALYLRHNYVPAPWTIYEATRKLPAAAIVTFRMGGPRWPTPEAYWSLRTIALEGQRHPLGGDAQSVADQVEDLLQRVVAQEMVADVPLGAFLSGGIDSSLVVALMQRQSARPIRTYTIGFAEAEYNEADHACRVARHLGTEHTELVVTPADALAVVPRLPTMYDEPFGDASQIPTFLVAELARREVTVALSGDGGDESFGGYQRYLLAPRIWRWLAPYPVAMRRVAGNAVRGISPGQWDRILPWIPGGARRGITGDRVHKLAAVLESPSQADIYRQLHSHWHDPSSVVIGGHEPGGVATDSANWLEFHDPVASMMACDSITYLPDDVLVKVDRATMTTSLEARAPLLHHEVVECAWRIPPDQRMVRGVGKMPLRRILAKYLPQGLIDRPKTGFGVPLDHWLRGPLREWADDLLASDRLRRDGYFNPDPIRTAWDEHQSGRRNRQYLLWDVLMFQAWLDVDQGRA